MATISNILLLLVITGNELVSGRRHRYHRYHQFHHKHHASGYFPFDFSVHRNRELSPIGLHEFEHITDDEIIPDSETYLDILEDELERQNEIRIRHHSKPVPVTVDVSLPEMIHWPVKKEAEVDGDLVLGGLMMVHEREDSITCGPVMPQGGIQALEAMLYTLDRINQDQNLLPNISLGVHILDDCDKDTYGLEMAVDFIKGKFRNNIVDWYKCMKL